MPRIPEQFIDAVLDKVDIVDVISEYVSLQKRGNKYLGLCPFHNEKTASFTVDGDKQLFYCFGCHVGGNVVGFLEKKENLTYIETIEELAKRANMPMPALESGGKPMLDKDTKNKILEANRAAARFYFNTLFEPEGVEGLEYFTQRGLTENIIKRFGLGYAPDQRDALVKHLKEKGFDEDIIVLAGLAQRNDYGVRDNFRTRVMFPIISPSGDVLGFGGRVLDKSLPKYLNTGDTPVFNKRKNLYALNILKKNNKGRAIIGEGYMDVIALNMAGFDYGVASLGTAVTPEQVRLLKRYAQEIYICYDGDKAGISATHKVIDLMREAELKPKIIALELGVDPDEFIKANGAEAFKEKMKTARTSIEYLMDEIKEQCDMNTEEGRASFAEKATAIVEKYAFNSIEMEMYIKRINQLSGFSVDALYDNIGTKAKTEQKEDKIASGILNKFESVTERALIAVLIENQHLIGKAKERLKDEYFESSAYLRIFKYLCELNEKTSLSLLIRAFEGDEQCSAALSSVGIENNVFGDAEAFLSDCCLKMTMEFLNKKRIELTAKMNQEARLEEKIALAGEIAQIDKEIKKIRSEF
ncbi:MAG: DNA primase [Clostridia bacterium]|nr:DNA primase [Clostridia bacterium]